MVRVVWSKNALFDLRHIKEYISYDSERYAKKITSEIIQRTKKPELHPKLGRIIPEIQSEEYKELIYGNYRIMFKVIRKEEILILAIFHSARDFDIVKIEPTT
ncbi:MAG: type II toxin-antitoxin system RelE/ParE family toxin [Chitinophagales bacterium]